MVGKTVFVVFLILTASYGTVFATGEYDYTTYTPVFQTNQTAQDKLSQTLLNIQYFLIGVAVLLAGIMIAIWGITFMVGSAEDMPPEKIAQRKRQLIYILIGLIIVLLSTVLVEIAKSLIVT